MDTRGCENHEWSCAFRDVSPVAAVVGRPPDTTPPNPAHRDDPADAPTQWSSARAGVSRALGTVQRSIAGTGGVLPQRSPTVTVGSNPHDVSGWTQQFPGRPSGITPEADRRTGGRVPPGFSRWGSSPRVPQSPAWAGSGALTCSATLIATDTHDGRVSIDLSGPGLPEAAGTSSRAAAAPCSPSSPPYSGRAPPR
jgi:hypothetical protein